MKKIKVGAVTYLNTKPLIYGMQQDSFLKEHELILSYPARLAEMLKKGELDVALVPVAILPELPQYHIVSDYCIASDYEVASVCLFSEKPLSEIKRVYLDYQSRTSVALLKILFREHWKQEVEWLAAADESYIDKIQGETAGLIIGDRALQFRDRFACRYDLVTAWREMTGLPFVFAVWVSVQQMNTSWINQFNSFQQKGFQQLDGLIDSNTDAQILYDLRRYFQSNLNYILDKPEQTAIGLFISKLPDLSLLNSYSAGIINSV